MADYITRRLCKHWDQILNFESRWCAVGVMFIKLFWLTTSTSAVKRLLKCKEKITKYYTELPPTIAPIHLISRQLAILNHSLTCRYFIQ